MPVCNCIHVGGKRSSIFIALLSFSYHSFEMPYTALQTLGYLARCSNWERIYNINRTPYRKGKATNCRLFAYRARYKKSGRKVVVLKRSGPRKIACGCGACCVCGKFIGMYGFVNCWTGLGNVANWPGLIQICSWTIWRNRIRICEIQQWKSDRRRMWKG